MKKIYIGNMSFGTTEDALENLFSKFGEVVSVTIKRDSFSELSKGFGFVEMTDDDAAMRAVSALNGKEVDGRKVRVGEAVEKSAQNTQNRRKFFEKKTNKASSFKKEKRNDDNSNEF